MTLQEYVQSIRNKRIAVIGAGVSNMPLIRLLLKNGCRVTVCDKRTLDVLGVDGEELVSLHADLKLGEAYLEGLDQDLIFRTPGLMPFDEHLLAAREKVERWGKSPPAAWRHVGAVNSIRSNTVGEHKGRPGRSREVA